MAQPFAVRPFNMPTLAPPVSFLRPVPDDFAAVGASLEDGLHGRWRPSGWPRLLWRRTRRSLCVEQLGDPTIACSIRRELEDSTDDGGLSLVDAPLHV